MRVVIADDAVLLREGIARLLEDAGCEVVAQAGSYDELLLRVRSYDPDVAVVDIRMPPTGTDEGIRAAKQIRAERPQTGVLVLSSYLEPQYALELLRTARRGSATSSRTAFERGRVRRGGAARRRRAARRSTRRSSRSSSAAAGASDPLGELTPREREVLGLMAEGRSNAAIAQQLVVTERAVEKHVTSIFGKLRLAPASEDHRRVLAVLTFLRSASRRTPPEGAGCPHPRPRAARTALTWEPQSPANPALRGSECPNRPKETPP